jgi:hypothetical protein
MVGTMTEPRSEGKKPAIGVDKQEKPDKSTLNVSRETAQLVGKIAAHRGKSIGEFFLDPDISNFLTHLLIEEMRQEETRLKRRK